MENQTWQQIAESIKIRIQVNNDTAKLYAAYGGIALALIVFTLPHLLDSPPADKLKCFFWLLFFGIGFLIISSLIFFWLARCLTASNTGHWSTFVGMTYGTRPFNTAYLEKRVLEISVKYGWCGSLKEVSLVEWEKEDSQVRKEWWDSVRKRQGVIHKLRWTGKFFGGLGLLLYALAIIFYLHEKYRTALEAL